MAQPGATDYRHTHKDLGLIMVNVYGFVFHKSIRTKNKLTLIQITSQTGNTMQLYGLVKTNHPSIFSQE